MKLIIIRVLITYKYLNDLYECEKRELSYGDIGTTLRSVSTIVTFLYVFCHLGWLGTTFMTTSDGEEESLLTKCKIKALITLCVFRVVLGQKTQIDLRCVHLKLIYD